MLLLMVAVVVSCLMTCVFRATEPRGYDGDNITLVNYVVCVLSSLFLAIRSGAINGYAHLGNADFSKIFTEENVANTALLALVLGVFSGIYYLANLVIMRRSYLVNGTGITVLFGKCAFLIPIVLAVVLWREIPNGLQIFGIALATFAMVLAFTSKGGASPVTRPDLLAVAFVISGLIQINSKLFVTYGVSSDYQSLFVLNIFVMALIICFFFVLWQNRKKGKKFRIAPREMVAGVLAGLPNVGFSLLQLKCLEILPAGIVYPTVAAGNLVLITIIGRVFFKEKLSRRQLVSVFITLTGLVLVNI